MEKRTDLEYLCVMDILFPTIRTKYYSKIILILF